MLALVGGWLISPYVVAVAIPLALIVCGGVAKKIVRGSSYESKDFYFGVELTLGTLGTCLTNLFDFIKSPVQGQANVASDVLLKNAVFVAISFCSLLFLLGLHQDWEARSLEPKKQVFWLGVFSNLVGALLMVSFILVVKGF
jgi:Na+/phosphate symporter